MIRITFEAKNREDLIETIRDYLGGEGYSRDIVVAPPVQIPKPEDYDAAPEPAPAPKTPEPTNTITKEDMRQVLISVRNARNPAGLRSLLNRFNASNLDDLDPKDYPAIVIAATEMLKEATDNG